MCKEKTLARRRLSGKDDDNGEGWRSPEASISGARPFQFWTLRSNQQRSAQVPLARIVLRKLTGVIAADSAIISFVTFQGKKMEGNAARYITRSQAVKSLQISIYLFRKLCILKAEDQGKSSDISYHTIDNRYPKFVEALRDLDDCLNRFLLGTCHLVDNEAKAMSLNMLRPSSGYRPLQEKKSLPMQGVRWHRGFG
nr:pescadillo homolog [Ipomoea batatas]